VAQSLLTKILNTECDIISAQKKKTKIKGKHGKIVSFNTLKWYNKPTQFDTPQFSSMFKIAHAMENQHMDRALINILLRMQLVELVRSL